MGPNYNGTWCMVEVFRLLDIVKVVSVCIYCGKSDRHSNNFQEKESNILQSVKCVDSARASLFI